MKIYLLILPILFCLTLFTGCEKEIEIDQTNIEPKIVLNCILNSDSSEIVAELSESRDLLYNRRDFPFIQSANIKLFENDQLVGEFVENSNYYSLAYQVKVGVVYKIKVIHPDFKNVEASTKIPSKMNISEVEYKRYDDLKVDISFNINDVKEELNYYSIKLIRADSLKDTTGGWNYNDPEYGYNPYVISTDYFCSYDEFIEYPEQDVLEGGSCNNRLFFSDLTFSNLTKNITAFSDYYYDSGYEKDQLNTVLDIEFDVLSKELYKYLMSISLFNSSGGPFTEPVRVFSNIENGFGIFGATNTYKFNILIE